MMNECTVSLGRYLVPTSVTWAMICSPVPNHSVRSDAHSHMKPLAVAMNGPLCVRTPDMLHQPLEGISNSPSAQGLHWPQQAQGLMRCSNCQGVTAGGAALLLSSRQADAGGRALHHACSLLQPLITLGVLVRLGSALCCQDKGSQSNIQGLNNLCT